MRVIDGVEMVEASFLWRDDGQHGSDPRVLIHFNTLTDNHRDHISPALATRVTDTSWWAHHVMLPVDVLVSYRIVVTAEPLPDDVGSQRAGWMRVHAAGRPDAFNPARLHDGFGFISSLWQGPRAACHPDWSMPPGAQVEGEPAEPGGCSGYGAGIDLGAVALEGFDAPEDPERRVTLWRAGRPSPELVGHGGGERYERGLLVLLDGEIWRGNDVVDRLGSRVERWDLLLIDSGCLAMRTRDLADPVRSRELLSRCLRAAEQAASGSTDPIGGRTVEKERTWSPLRIVVAGQSLGGVAAADFVLLHPELASRAIVQSGSFWLGSGRRGEGDGELLTWLRRRAEASTGSERLEGQCSQSLTDRGARLVVQCGVHEDALRRGARTAANLLDREGALVGYCEERGGHDYAWWRHGLSWGLDAHEQELGLSSRADREGSSPT